MSDALEQAKRELDIATSALDASGSSRSYAEMTRAAECAQAAAQIAQAEATRAQNAILERIAVVLEDVHDPVLQVLRMEAFNWGQSEKK